ncbi:MAG: response regulator transcription factor [Deltaproteobacteria bacterium]|nr:response regulator transcription factor [Deltaproteobacteria bacterium]
MKVLIAEDDALTRQALSEIMEEEGYQVIQAKDGLEAWQRYNDEAPDFLCLDIMMPGMDGFALCRKIRGENSNIPIVFISAKGEEIDKVVGLELGADDFITKPFGMREVIARIRAVTRRCLASRPEPEPKALFSIGDLEVSPAELRARRGTEVIELSLRDLRLLKLFADHPNEVMDRNTIMDECWGINYLPSSRTLDQHISQLRKRIELDPKNPRIILTVHGAGYRYDPSLG